MPLVIVHHLLNVSIQLTKKRGFKQNKNLRLYVWFLYLELEHSEIYAKILPLHFLYNLSKILVAQEHSLFRCVSSDVMLTQ
jgi:hypothetical protein